MSKPLFLRDSKTKNKKQKEEKKVKKEEKERQTEEEKEKPVNLSDWRGWSLRDWPLRNSPPHTRDFRDSSRCG